ncbi:MAG: DUF1810 domain-containing protein [Chloroflexi bacterium]|nr:DUF1810 domain-containing protein [Chloroflexota bacterium]
MSNANNESDPYDLGRFLSAQEDVYFTALSELKAGEKRTHWMWFIFPQIEGLGRSEISKRYSIKNLEETSLYLSHPVLGQRLIECSEMVLDIEGRTVLDIFYFPDNHKLHSCMTLFLRVAGDNSMFASVLEKYFDGVQDGKTLKILKDLERNAS